MKCSYFGFIIVLSITFIIEQACCDFKKLKSKTRFKTKGRLFKSVGKQVNPSPRNSSTLIGRNRTFSHRNVLSASPKLHLRWKVLPNNTTISTKRQNVVSLIGDPNSQRLFHLDETGTLHRHEVGPEEFSTPEGKTRTFTNEKGVLKKPAPIMNRAKPRLQEPSTRQMQLNPGTFRRPAMAPFSSYQVYSRPSPLRPSPLLPSPLLPQLSLPPPPRTRFRPLAYTPPAHYYYQSLPMPRPQVRYVPVTKVKNVPYPVAVPIRQPPIMKPVPIPVPYPVASPPKIRNVPYPVAVPIRSPPQIHIQKVPYPVPVPPPVARPTLQRFFIRPVVPMPVGLGECATSPCRNKGICYAVEDTYKCHCATGFKGIHCEDTSKCHPNPCENFGECTVLKDGYECSCRKGFRGTRCEVKDQCRPNPCRNGGSCTSVANEYACSCIYGFIGNHCEVESKCFPLNPCQHGGTCHEDDVDYKCTCMTGWDGISCEIPDPCSRNPCNHGGECIAIGNTFTCSCPTGYLGKTCELESQCHSKNPCRNGGRCIEHGLEGYKCYCNSRWNGGNCQIPAHSIYH